VAGTTDRTAESERPRLRMLEAFPVQQGQERMVALRDPSGLTDQVAVFPIPLLDLVSLFDGEHSIAEMQAILRRRHGAAPGPEQIGALVRSLDEAGLLESERFRERRQAIEDAFRQSPTRPATHAGSAYEGDPAGLASQISSFFLHPHGPGPPGGARRDGTAPLRGLIAPHIDFHRGGPTYAWAYRELLERSDADLFVVLGTCHVGMPDPFAATLKPFETPCGPVEVDRELFETVARRSGQDLLASELAHRNEHSVEFQAVMLRVLLGNRRPFTILPVLASFLHDPLGTRRDPEADRRVPAFIDALLQSMAASSRKICVIAGVDLAHVGPRFGDQALNTAASLERVAAADRSMLEAVTGGEATAFFASVAADGDQRRICGLSPIYTFLRVLPGVRGRLLRYAQWPDPEGAVSFCAAAFP